ncbi:hypothetical protein KSP39_PZI004922 [Platanthera zijinensis]|uniref:Uncharacterized protein n=1 Tax=Platanthera zijinensis TaxID=2320716 RepID=A0AAP0GC15_9ASPA
MRTRKRDLSLTSQTSSSSFPSREDYQSISKGNQSFTSISNVRGVEDLAKPEKIYPNKSHGGGLDYRKAFFVLRLSPNQHLGGDLFLHWDPRGMPLPYPRDLLFSKGSFSSLGPKRNAPTLPKGTSLQ